MRRIVVVSVAAVALTAGTAAWWWAPHVAASRIRAAAVAGDVDRLAERVDIESVRAGLKRQLRDRVASSVAAQQAQTSAVGAAIGGQISSLIIDRAVDEMTAPAALRALIARGGPLRTGDDQSRPAEWSIQRLSADTALAFPSHQADLSPSARDRFVLARTGIADWRLVEIRLAGVY